MSKRYLTVTVGTGTHAKRYRVPKPTIVEIPEAGDSLDRRLRAHRKVDLRRGPIRVFTVPDGFHLDNVAKDEDAHYGVFKGTWFGALRQLLHWWQRECESRIVEQLRFGNPVQFQSVEQEQEHRAATA